MGHSWPLSLFWFKARIPYQTSIFFFPECAFCLGVDGTKWNVEETTLPRTQLSLPRTQSHCLLTSSTAHGVCLPSPLALLHLLQPWLT